MNNPVENPRLQNCIYEVSGEISFVVSNDDDSLSHSPTIKNILSGTIKDFTNLNVNIRTGNKTRYKVKMSVTHKCIIIYIFCKIITIRMFGNLNSIK